MSKIALKMVEEMQLSWEYGQGFHLYSITYFPLKQQIAQTTRTGIRIEYFRLLRESV